MGSYGVGQFSLCFGTWRDFSNMLTQRYNSLHGTNLQECYACSGSGTAVTCSTAIQPIYACSGYRLLSEAEWEYSARAGTTAAFWTPNGGAELPSGFVIYQHMLTDGFDLNTYAWYFATYNSPYGTKEVALLMPNDNDLYDMSGNLYEWTHDGYVASLGTGSVTDPVQEQGSQYVNRAANGGWRAIHNRSARRTSVFPTARTDYMVSCGTYRQCYRAIGPRDLTVSGFTHRAGRRSFCVIDTDL